MEDIFKKRKSVLATIDKIEKEVAVLKFDDGQVLNWSLENLPADIEEGSRIKLVLFSDRSEQVEREELAKTVLNEILKTE